jgi:hypothetical protein
VPTKVYDRTIGVLKSAVQAAKLGREEELAAIRRLDAQARRLERDATGPTIEALVARERRDSHAYGGRSVFGREPPRRDVPPGGEAAADPVDAAAGRTAGRRAVPAP